MTVSYIAQKILDYANNYSLINSKNGLIRWDNLNKDKRKRRKKVEVVMELLFLKFKNSFFNLSTQKKFGALIWHNEFLGAICPVCGEPKKYLVPYYGFYETCGNKNKEHIDFMRACKNKSIKKTFEQNYPEGHPSRSPGIVEEKEKTCLDKYDSTCPLGSKKVRSKSIITWLEKYGVDNPAKSDIIKKRTIYNNRQKYGVDYPMQLPEIFEKQNKSCKTCYIFSFNEYAWWLRGYEKFFIKSILTTQHPSQIINSNFRFGYNFNNQSKYYYPDFSINHIFYEVKSIYTLFADFFKNIAKSTGVKNCGFRHLTYTYKENGEIIGIH